MSKKESLTTIFICLLLGCLYFLTLPTTVQHGDTGELISNARFLTLSHPPGYPLFSLLMAIPTHLVSPELVFASAGFLQIIFSLLTLALIFCFGFSQVSYLAIPITILVGTSRIFWEYSVLPDVFMLHCLFIAAISYFYFAPETKRNLQALILVFCIGLTNHQTLIFLTPLILVRIYQSKDWMGSLKTIGLGFVGFIVINLLLLIFKTSDLGSWGNVDSLEGLMAHVLRKEYGTFSLASNINESTFLDILGLFFETIAIDFWALTLLLISGIMAFGKNKKVELKTIVYGTTFLFYLFFFFYLMKIQTDGTWRGILERFFLMPQMMFVFLAIICVGQFRKSFPFNKNYVLGFLVFIGLNIVLNFSSNFNLNNFRKNTVVEDYAKNMLRPLPPNAILVISGDTEEFAINYVQRVLGFRKDIIVVSPVMFVHKWYIQKLKSNFPKFVYADQDQSRSFGERIFNVIEGNFDHSEIFISPIFFNLKMLTHYNLEYKGLLAKVTTKFLDQNGTISYHCTQPYIRQSPPEVFEASTHYSSARYFENFYGFCDLYAGQELLKNGLWQEAMVHYQQSYKLVGFENQALEMICKLQKEHGLKLEEECSL